MSFRVRFDEIPKLFKCTGDKPCKHVCTTKDCVYGDDIYFVRHKNGVINFGYEINKYFPEAEEICSNCEETKKAFKILLKKLEGSSIPFEMTVRSIPSPFRLFEEHPVLCPDCEGTRFNGNIIRQIKVYYPVLVESSPRGWFNFYDHRYWEKSVYGKCQTCKGKGYIWKSVKKNNPEYFPVFPKSDNGEEYAIKK